MTRHDRAQCNTADLKDPPPAQNNGQAAWLCSDTSGRRSRAADLTADQGTLAALLLRTGHGDREAFTVLYELTSQRVYGHARKTIVSAEISQETTQEIYLLVWQNASKYNPSAGSAMAWLMTITHSRAVDRVRAEQARINTEARWGAKTQSIEYDVVAETVTATIDARTVMRCLDTLSPIQREAISLAYYNCMTYREVAEQLSAPLSTIKTRIRDGLKQLRACLDEA